MSVTLVQAVFLGVLQGLTEFLPVSSSAHLIVAQHLLPGFRQPGILFDVMLHVGTLVAVVVHFRTRLAETVAGLLSKEAGPRRAAWRLAGLLALSVAATGAIAYPLRALSLEGMESLPRVGAALLLTSCVLLAAQAVGARRGEAGRPLEELRARDALLIGACQAASAVFRGFSRSGNTISVGLFSGLSRRAAAEYSFLLSIPTILAAAAVENLHAYRETGQVAGAGTSLAVYAAGMAAAGVVGYAAIAVLLRLVLAMRFQAFIVYCALLGAVLVLTRFV